MGPFARDRCAAPTPKRNSVGIRWIVAAYSCRRSDVVRIRMIRYAAPIANTAHVNGLRRHHANAVESELPMGFLWTSARPQRTMLWAVALQLTSGSGQRHRHGTGVPR